MSAVKSRKYELVLLGATGHTGRLCAEYISEHLPTSLIWAVAGRSESKLRDLVAGLHKINSDRRPPDIEVGSLSPVDLDSLVIKATVVINTVGPYHLYSSPIVAACAKNGTHYLDVTGEAPWVLDMIHQNHELAKSNRAMLIPQIGVESAPPDLLVWSLVDLLRRRHPQTVGRTGLKKQVIGTLHEMKSIPSGGTMATVLSITDSYDMKSIRQATTWAHSPIPKSRDFLSRRTDEASASTFLSRIQRKVFGIIRVPHLGILGDAMTSAMDTAAVQRTWGLLDAGNFYGQDFSYHEYGTYSNIWVAALARYVIALGFLFLTFRPVRWALKKVVYQPGQGPTRARSQRDSVEHRALAVVEKGDDGKEVQAVARLRFEGGLYHFTALLAVEAAMCLLHDGGSSSQGLEGGLLTPACLGQAYIDRLGKAGASIECNIVT